MGRTTVYTDITMDAFALVDDRQGFPHGDRTLRAGTDAFLASDTTDITVLAGSGTRPLILTSDRHGSRDRHQLDEFLRTYFHALSAAVTQRTVDMTDAVLQGNGTEGTYRNAVSESETAESAGVRSAQKSAGGVTTGSTQINISLTGLLAGTLTTRHRDFLLRHRRFGSEDRSDLSRAVHAADGAECSIGTGLGQVIGITLASGKTAAATVGTR